MANFIAGALAMGYWLAGLIFLKSWMRTSDRLFAAFATAFWILAVVRCALVLSGDMAEHTHYWYGLRLMAYLLILFAIIDKNRPARFGSSLDESPRRAAEQI